MRGDLRFLHSLPLTDIFDFPRKFLRRLSRRGFCARVGNLLLQGVNLPAHLIQLPLRFFKLGLRAGHNLGKLFDLLFQALLDRLCLAGKRNGCQAEDANGAREPKPHCS